MASPEQFTNRDSPWCDELPWYCYAEQSDGDPTLVQTEPELPIIEMPVLFRDTAVENHRHHIDKDWS